MSWNHYRLHDYVNNIVRVLYLGPSLRYLNASRRVNFSHSLFRTSSLHLHLRNHFKTLPFVSNKEA